MLTPNPKKHIRPYHRLQTVPPADIADAVQVAGNHIKGVLKTVFFQKLSRAEVMRLVRTDMNLLMRRKLPSSEAPFSR